MTYHSDPVPFWCPLDPAVGGAWPMRYWDAWGSHFGAASRVAADAALEAELLGC